MISTCIQESRLHTITHFYCSFKDCLKTSILFYCECVAVQLKNTVTCGMVGSSVFSSTKAPVALSTIAFVPSTGQNGNTVKEAKDT